MTDGQEWTVAWLAAGGLFFYSNANNKMDLLHNKKELRYGNNERKIVECFVITPNINVSWIKFTGTNVYYIQFAWLFWYITFATKKVRL